MRQRIRLFLAVVSALAGNASHAEWRGYLAGDAMASAWKLGFASGDSKLVAESTATNTYQTISPTTAPLYMGGLSATVIHDERLAFSYQAEFGVANALVPVSQNTDKGLLTVDTSDFSTQYKITRLDQQATATWLLGSSGWMIFLGGKYQRYAYNFSESGGVNKLYKGSLLLSQSTFSFSGDSVFSAWGPALGFGYMRPLFGDIHAGAQLGFIYLWGSDISNRSTSRAAGTSGSYSDQRFNAIGFTVVLPILIPLSERFFLQIALRGQFYAMQVTSRQVTTTAVNGAVTVSNPPNSESVFDNSQDWIYGLQVIFVARIF